MADKVAMQKLYRDNNGVLRSILVDIATGETIPPSRYMDYKIYDSQAAAEQEIGAKPKEEEKSSSSTTKVTQNPIDEINRRGGSERGSRSDLSGRGNRSVSNNFGYMNKPGWMGLTSFAPGPLGMAGKAVNTAVNANNVAAVSQARSMLGLKPTGVGGAIKGALKDTQGKIANVDINNQNYSVGFEAMNKGRTNLTPDEARVRGALAGGITETKPDTALAGVKSFVDGLWGGKSVEEMQREETVARELAPDRPSSLNPPENQRAGMLSDENVGTQVAQDTIERGSLANVAGNSYAHPERGAWQSGLTPETIESANRLSGAIGGMNITSAHRNSAINAAVGGAKRSQHIQGNALDISTRGMTDEQKQKAVEMGRLSGFSRIGTYPDQSLHLDMAQGYSPAGVQGAIQTVDGTYGMVNRSGVNAAQRAPGWFERGMTMDTFAPTPTARPDELDLDAPTTGSVVRENVTNAALDALSGVDMTKATPAQMSNMGFGPKRSAEEMEALGVALAGELSPSSLRGLAAGQPEAIAELSNMVSTVENRAQSVNYQGQPLGSVLAGQKYNSMLAKNMPTTLNNFSTFGPSIMENIAGFYSGNVAPTTPGATHYYNAEVSNPGWGAAMTSPSAVGEHKFGSLPGEYRPGAMMDENLSRYAGAQINNQTSKGGFQPDMGFAGSGPNLGGIGAGPGRGQSMGGPSLGSDSRERSSGISTSGIGRNDTAGAGRGSSMGGPGIGGSRGSSGTPGGGNQGTSGRGGVTDNRGGSVSAENADRDTGRSSREGSSTRGGESAGGRNRGEY